MERSGAGSSGPGTSFPRILTALCDLQSPGGVAASRSDGHPSRPRGRDTLRPVSDDGGPSARGSTAEGSAAPRPASWRSFAVAGIFVAAALLIVFLRLPVLSRLVEIGLWLLALVAAGWLVVAALRRLLWSVGNRLAFSYFLLGVLPIPMVLLLALVGAYLLSGFFLTHQVRSALASIHGEVATVATLASDAWAFEEVRPSSPFADISIAYYEDGVRIEGSHTAPEAWPTWLEEETVASARGAALRSRLPPIVAFEDGAITVAAAQRVGERGVIAYFDSDLARATARRAAAWVELTRKDDPGSEAATTFQIGDNQWTFQPLRRAEARGSIDEFFGERDLPARRLIIGLDSLGPLFAFADGAMVSANVSATVFAPPAAILRNLFSNSREVDTVGWAAFIVPAFLLFDLYVVAAVMAVFLIAGLSRAVNQLSTATSRVQEGDFDTRIEVRRRDQLGALQTTFNQMTENLQRAVAEATQKELIDKELEIARDLQRSLLPVQLHFGERIEVASFFEPSAAIGGDYYDIVPLDEGRSRLAIAIADVSGHGLPAGLRTAMLKAGLEILVRERKATEDIFHALDRIVRSGTERTFVTATLTILDLGTRAATITNAGHCPTYHLDALRGEVTEIVLPGTPLGALRQRYGEQRIDFAPGDALVWLSDGLIEAENPHGDVFGYDRTVAALEGAWSAVSERSTSSAELRDAMVDAVREWSGGVPPQDDRTLVVLRSLDPRRGGPAEEVDRP